MNSVYFITEEHRTGADSCQYGVWVDFIHAQEELKKIVENDEYFTSESQINFDEGIAYCEQNEDEEYTFYKIEMLPILDEQLDNYLNELLKHSQDIVLNHNWQNDKFNIDCRSYEEGYQKAILDILKEVQ